MNNIQLIESLEYHTQRINEGEKDWRYYQKLEDELGQTIRKIVSNKNLSDKQKKKALEEANELMVKIRYQKLLQQQKQKSENSYNEIIRNIKSSKMSPQEKREAIEKVMRAQASNTNNPKKTNKQTTFDGGFKAQIPARIAVMKMLIDKYPPQASKNQSISWGEIEKKAFEKSAGPDWDIEKYFHDEDED